MDKKLYSFDELKLIPKKHGIYVIHHTPDGKQYIGQGKLDKRLQMHKLNAMRGSRFLPIYFDMHLEGLDNFSIEIVHVQEIYEETELLRIEKAIIEQRGKFTSLYNRMGVPRTSISQRKQSAPRPTNAPYFWVRYNGREARGTHIMPKNLSGIYKIYPLADPEKVYIGKTVDIKGRCSSHIYAVRKVEDQQRPLYRDVYLYGIEQFCFEVIETCPEDQLLERERYWIQVHNALIKGYNDRLPQTREELTNEVNKRLARGEGVKQIAEACDASHNTVRRIKEQGTWLQLADKEALIKKGKVYNENQIRAVRIAHAQGQTHQEIMGQFGLTYKAVDGIIHNKIWINVTIKDSEVEKVRSIKSRKIDVDRINIKRQLFSGMDLREVSASSGYTKEYLAMILKGQCWTDIHVEEEETYHMLVKEVRPTLEEVAQIKHLVSQGIGTDSDLARKYRINRSIIRSIRRGERWKDIAPHPPDDIEQIRETLKKRLADPRNLAPQEVAHIKYLLQHGSTVQELARIYGVPHSAISKIKSGARWSGISSSAPAIIQPSLFDEDE